MKEIERVYTGKALDRCLIVYEGTYGLKGELWNSTEKGWHSNKANLISACNFKYNYQDVCAFKVIEHYGLFEDPNFCTKRKVQDDLNHLERWFKDLDSDDKAFLFPGLYSEIMESADPTVNINTFYREVRDIWKGMSWTDKKKCYTKIYRSR